MTEQVTYCDYFHGCIQLVLMRSGQLLDYAATRQTPTKPRTNPSAEAANRRSRATHCNNSIRASYVNACITFLADYTTPTMPLYYTTEDIALMDKCKCK